MAVAVAVAVVVAVAVAAVALWLCGTVAPPRIDPVCTVPADLCLREFV